MKKFPLIHCRSSFSLLRGCHAPEELCRRAAVGGRRVLGLTDTGNFYGLVRFALAAREHGLKPLYGAVLEQDGERLATAFCLDPGGFARLNRIISRQLGGLPAGSEEGPFDLLTEFETRGWEGLWIASDNRRVLARLMRHSRTNLFAALYYGRPFGTLASWARRQGIPLLALADIVAWEEGDLPFFRLLRSIDRCIPLDDLPAHEALGEGHIFRGDAVLDAFFSAVPDAVENARRFCREAIAYRLPKSYIFPAADGMSEHESFQRLRQLCMAGIRRRYGQRKNAASLETVRKRLNYELGIIRDKGFAAYFLVVHDIVSTSRRTCGRGSSAASIVSYLLGITHVDPIAYNLFFERFLNEGRIDPPDIDVDFPWDERTEALQYVFRRYPCHSGMVADHVTFALRSSLREPAKACGVSDAEITRLVGCLRRGEREKIPPYLLTAAERLRGMPHYIGTHPGGVVITPEPIWHYTHIQKSPLGYPVIAWEKDAAEDAGLVKIDLLGNRSLGVLRDTIAMVNQGGRHRIEWDRFTPLDDAGTRNLIESGETLGIFYIESPATRQLLKKMGSGDYEHLVVASSIIRPAANRYINQYVERLRGEPWQPLHPLIEETLRETCGIMVYQEDVSRVAIAIAGFSAAEADRMRKTLSRKHRAPQWNAFRESFFSGGLARGVEADVLRRLWEMILSFRGYSFCKAHSASYALVSYKLAWLKLRYPLEFLVSVINNGGGFYARQVYVNTARRMGFRVLGPDVNRSELRYTVENGNMRVGLAQLKSVPEPFLAGLLETRRAKGPFHDLDDFRCRTKAAFPVMRILIRSGAVDSLGRGKTRPQLFWDFLGGGRSALFDVPLNPLPVQVGDYRDSRKLRDEVSSTGLFLSCHPLTPLRPRIARLVNNPQELTDSRFLRGTQAAGRRVLFAGTLVTGKEVTTKNRNAMCFLTFEDEYGLFETVLFPEVWERFHALLESGFAFLVSGTVEEAWGSCQIQVKTVRSLHKSAVRPAKAVWFEYAAMTEAVG